MEKWNDIVVSLLECKNNNVSENLYQAKIEEQFKFLGWSIYNGCVETKPALPVGNSKIIVPDIVLRKDGERVLPIEIKEPNNKLKKRQEEQLFSYMKQLDLRIGLYIGEKWQLYYNSTDDKNDPHVILTASLIPDSAEGNTLCKLLSYDLFSTETIESFCQSELEKQRFTQNTIAKLDELNEDNKGVQLMYSLLCNHLGIDESNEDLTKDIIKKVTITYQFGEKKRTTTDTLKERKKLTRYSLNGGPALPKTKFALEAIRLYVLKHPSAKFVDIEATFPRHIQGGYGVVRKMSELEDYVESGSNIMGRFSSTPQEILISSDGIRFAVCNQWDYNNLPRLISILKKLKWRVKEVK
ncbi:MAG: hypothetical protein IJ785_07925 [Bacteroidales bacterium]|nr:hypothetical protein [Bacteroidales bacterium]